MSRFGQSGDTPRSSFWFVPSRRVGGHFPTADSMMSVEGAQISMALGVLAAGSSPYPSRATRSAIRSRVAQVGSVGMVPRTLGALQDAANLAPGPARRQAPGAHVELLAEWAGRAVPSSRARSQVQARLNGVRAALDGEAASSRHGKRRGPP